MKTESQKSTNKDEPYNLLLDGADKRINSTQHETVNEDAKLDIFMVAKTGLYPYRCCFTIKVKPSPDFQDKNWWGKLKYFKSVIMTSYSLFITLYLTFIVSMQKSEYDFLHLNPDYSFSKYYEVIWRLRYLNYFGLFQMLLSLGKDDYDETAMSSGINQFNPKARYYMATQYGNVKDSPLNYIRFITKSLTLTNLTVNILLLAGSADHYSTTALVLLIIQTVNDYFVVSDFNTYDAKFKPNGICQSIKVRLIELFTNWYMIIGILLMELAIVMFAVVMIVVFLLCCLTCCCCGRFNFEKIAEMFGMGD